MLPLIHSRLKQNFYEVCGLARIFCFFNLIGTLTRYDFDPTYFDPCPSATCFIYENPLVLGS